MLTSQQIEQNLNLRNYWKEGIGIETPPAITPPIPPSTPPGDGLIEKYGSLAIVSIGLLFLLAIFPGQTEPSGGAE